MTDTTQLQVIFGTISAGLLPIIVSYLKNCAWSDKVKSFLSVLVALILGVASVFLAKGTLTVENVAETFTAVYTASHLIYVTWFKRLTFNAWLESKDVL